MKKLLCISIVLMFIASSIGAEEDFSSYATDGQANGRYWNVLSQTDKFAFITGVDEAITTCAEIELAYIEGGTDTKEREKRRSLFRYFAATSPEEVTLAELIKQIDDYYSKEENLDTPIMSIYFRMTADKKASSEKNKRYPSSRAKEPAEIQSKRAPTRAHHDE